jgi:YVTN family beta-propeller protein
MRKRSTGIAAIILLTVLALGCGSTFRPIATPIPEPGGDPNSLKRAIVVTDNGGSRGGVSIINTTGDTNLGNVPAGVGPVHAGFVTVARTYIANQAENTVTRILTSSPGSTPATIPMPAGCAPQYVFNRLTANAYVACPGNDSVAVLSAVQDSVITSVALAAGAGPVGINQTFNGNKVYSLNGGNGTVTVIAALDNTVSTTIAVGGSPTWSDMSQDGALLFVANASGYVTPIDTATDTALPNITVGANPTFVAFDSNRRRLYVVNQGGGSVSVIDAVSTSPTYLTVIGTVTVGATPTSATALRNGTKVYVSNCGSDSVSVIDAASLAVTKTIATGTCPISVASPTDSSRAVVGVQGAAGGTDFTDPPSILDISTQTDTVVVNLKPAQQSAACDAAAAPNNYCALQRPVFVVMTP